MEVLYQHEPRIGVLNIFDSAQQSKKSHGRLITNLFSIYQKNSWKDFAVEYAQSLCLCFYGEKGPFVEVVLDFAAKYFAYHVENIKSEDDPFVLFIYEFLFKNYSGEQRLRMCEFINKILSAMGDEATIDDDIFQMLADSMLDRLQDKSANVRVQAVMALRRLQEPHEKDCSIIKALKYHLEHDPNHEVRAKVLSLIAVTQKTLPAILTRINDKSDMVRKEFYRTASRLKLLRFTLKKRQEIIEFGFRDRSESVRDLVANTLVASWFEQCNKNHVKLLSCFDVETFGDTAKKLLFSIFEKQSTFELIDMMRNEQVKDRKVIATENINPELAVLWQCLVSYLASLSPDSEIDNEDVSKILPELTHFTNYIREYMTTTSHKKNQKLFILQQLLEICSFYWLCDEMGRQQLKHLCVEMLINDEIDISVVPVLIKALNRTIPCVKTRISTVAEVISDIRNPLHVVESSSKISNGEVTNADLEKDMELIQNKMSELRPMKPDEFPEEDCETRNDSETLIKCLTILKETLKSSDILKLDEVLLTMKNHFISQCIQDKKTQVLSLSVNVLDLMCLRSLSLAKEMFYKFFVLIYEGILQIPPLQAVFNILANYGFEAFPLEVNFNMSNVKGEGVWPTIEDFLKDKSLPSLYIKHVVAQLSGFLDSSEREVKIATCQGFIKLFISGRLSSPIVLSQLVLLWYSPSTEFEPLIRQPLGLFFANCSQYCPNIPEVICQSVIVLLEVLSNSSAASNYISIEVDSVVCMLISLVRHDTLQSQSNVSKSGASYHLMIAEMICDEIIAHRIGVNIIFIKIIPKLTIISSDSKHALSLNEKLKRVIQISKKKTKRLQNVFCDFQRTVENVIYNETEDNLKNNTVSNGVESPGNLSETSDDTNPKKMSSLPETRFQISKTGNALKEDTVVEGMVVSESDEASSMSDSENEIVGNNEHQDSDNYKTEKPIQKPMVIPDSDPDSNSDTSGNEICPSKKSKSNYAEMSGFALLDEKSLDQKSEESTEKVVVPNSDSEPDFHSASQIKSTRSFIKCKNNSNPSSDISGCSVKTRKQCSRKIIDSSSESSSSSVRTLRSSKRGHQKNLRQRK